MKKCDFNKRMQNYLDKWFNQNSTELEHCYIDYSIAKLNAFRYCQQIKKKYNGQMGIITSYNKFVFTYSFVEDVEDGSINFYVITPSQDTYCNISRELFISLFGVDLYNMIQI